MSRYEWEEGTIKIPSESFAALRTAVNKSYNRYQDAKFKLAMAAYKAAGEAGFRKRGFSRANWVSNHQKYLTLAHLITKPGSNKVYVPKRKDLKHVPVSRSGTLIFGDGIRISFNNKTCTVFYSVPENNHAVENANKHPVVVSLFQNLRMIQHWTRGSGGEICGNDEYNRENTQFDGGANYVTRHFPEEKTPKFNGLYFTTYGRNF